MKLPIIQQCYQDLTAVFYPRLCMACSRQTPPGYESFCLHCDHTLPKTDFHETLENYFMDRFWGRVPVQAAAAYFYFKKGGLVQQLVHRLKYNEKKQIGTVLGQRYGQILGQSPLFNDIDCIVPVPLHPYKEKLRGYNQSAVFGMGLAETMKLPCLPHALMRHSFTETQTRKGRFDRINNVGDVFDTNQAKLLRGKHILLVDDVVTTGATLESCALTLLDIPDTKVSFATIAFARY